MSKTMCPGQDTRFWKPEDIFEVACGACGNVIEFFKDEGQRRCTKCGARVRNPKLAMGCAQWCEHAKECLGFDPKEMQLDGEGVSLADKLVDAMKKEFGDDQKRVTHALKVLETAEEILQGEEADPKVVIAAALLHDIGYRAALEKHGDKSAKMQQIEGPPVAERIMKELDLDNDTIEHVCGIVGCHHDEKGMETPEFSVIWDADNIVNFADKLANGNDAGIDEFVDDVLKTESGKAYATRILSRTAE